MRDLLRATTALLAVTALVGPVLVRAADDIPALRKHHPWARFNLGSWNEVRVVTETLDEQGKVTGNSITDTRTTLESVAADGITLRVEVEIELGNRRIVNAPQIVKEGWVGEQSGQTVSVKPLEPATLVIDGRSVSCDSQQIEILGGGRRRVMLVNYSDRIAPFILRRKTTASDGAENSAVAADESEAEVVALDMPTKVVDEMKNAAHLRVIQKGPGGTTITLSVNTHEVPGEVISYTSKKLDAQGHTVRRSTLELVGYCIAAKDPDDPGQERGRTRRTRGRSTRR